MCRYALGVDNHLFSGLNLDVGKVGNVVDWPVTLAAIDLSGKDLVFLLKFEILDLTGHQPRQELNLVVFGLPPGMECGVSHLGYFVTELIGTHLLRHRLFLTGDVLLDSLLQVFRELCPGHC